MIIRRTLILALLLTLGAAPAAAQRVTQALARAPLTAGVERCTTPIQHVGADGRVTLESDLRDAHRLDPTRRYALRIDIAPAETGPWQSYAGAETHGTPQREPGVQPSVSRSAPPSGWWSRGCVSVVAGSPAVDTGVTLQAIEGRRRPALPVVEHNSVAYDADVEVTGNAVGTITTGSFTIAGSDRVGVAGVTWRQTGINLSSVTVATVSASLVSGAAGTIGNREAEVWCAIAPSTGSQTASATFSNTWGNDLSLHVITFTGADQTTPCQNGTSATGIDTTPTVTVSSAAADDMVVDATATGAFGINITAGANQTASFVGTQNHGLMGGSYQDGADGGVMSWTIDNTQEWVIAAVRVVAAAAAGASPCLRGLLGVGCEQ